MGGGFIAEDIEARAWHQSDEIRCGRDAKRVGKAQHDGDDIPSEPDRRERIAMGEATTDAPTPLPTPATPVAPPAPAVEPAPVADPVPGT